MLGKRRFGFLLADLCAIVGIVATVTASALMGLSRAREMANRVACAANLRMIGQSIMMYANAEARTGYSYPRTFFKPDGALTQTDAGNTSPSPGFNQPLSFDETGKPSPVGDNNVMASFFMILKTQDIRPNAFVCPTAGLQPDDFSHPADPTVAGQAGYTCWNAPANAHLSYSMQVPFPSREAVASGFRWNAAIAPDMAILADINPGTQELLSVSPSSPPSQLQAANSPNHYQEGQNVGYGDGHVEWQPTPFAGAIRGTGPGAVADNIYSYGGPPSTVPAGIIGQPVDNLDSILLPVVGQGFVAPRLSAFERNPLLFLAIFFGIAILVIGGIVIGIILMVRKKPAKTPPPLPPTN